MEIGGSDLVFPTPLTISESRDLVKKLVQDDWPFCCSEWVEDGSPDLFIYENLDSMMKWQKDDATGIANMMQALFRENEITLVHDEGSKELARSIALYFLKLDVMAKNPICCPTCCVPIKEAKDGTNE